MIRVAFVLALLPALAFAQDLAARGAEIYNKSCATGYCHGLQGTQGGAPRLADRGLDEGHIVQVVRSGISGTAMPAFGSSLPDEDLAAVIAYVANLNGISPSSIPTAPRGPTPRKLPPEAELGRRFFFDATLGFSRCSTCHQVDGKGIAVAAPISRIPESVPALKELATPHVGTATVGGESFPALTVSKGGTQVSLYDLTVPPPVLRTFPSASLKLSEGSDWRHASLLAIYPEANLERILNFLRAVRDASSKTLKH